MMLIDYGDLERPMEIEVVGYNDKEMAHRCRLPNSVTSTYVDLVVSADLPSKYRDNPRTLIGKTVSVKSMHPYVLIGQGVKVMRKVGAKS